MKFRKTALIEAEQWFPEKAVAGVCEGSCTPGACGTRETAPHVHTLEGSSYTVTPGMWIATGSKGEHWPIADEVFRATYEPAETPPASFCDVCPHALALHNADGSCDCGVDCVQHRINARSPA